MTMTNQWRHKFHFILTLARLGDVANVRVITTLQNGLIKQLMAIIDVALWLNCIILTGLTAIEAWDEAVDTVRHSVALYQHTT